MPLALSDKKPEFPDATTRVKGSDKKNPRARVINPRTTARWQARFVKSLRYAPSVSAACKAAGVARTTAYRHRDENEVFASKWQDAIDASVDVVEARCFKLASEGDPRLIEFILKAHRPQVYRDRQEIAVAAGVIILPAKENKAP
jgi:hypothetical protein